MASGSTPHFQNSAGLPAIEVGTREFMRIGAKPPFDHPHIFRRPLVRWHEEFTQTVFDFGQLS